MSARLIYNAQSVTIYITRQALPELIYTGNVHLDLYLAGDYVAPDCAALVLSDQGQTLLREYLAQEVQTVDSIRKQFQDSNPDYTNNRTRKNRRRKRGATP